VNDERVMWRTSKRSSRGRDDSRPPAADAHLAADPHRGERRRWRGAAQFGRVNSAAGSRLTPILLLYRLLRGAPPVYFRRLIDKVDVALTSIAANHDGWELVKYDISPKDVPRPIEVTPEEAADALKRAGQALADAEIVEERIHTAYSRSALAYDLLAAIGFLCARRPRRKAGVLFALTILRNLRYAMPGLGSGAIHRAELEPWQDEDESKDCPVSIRRFGRVLRDNATTIVFRPEKIDMAVHNQLVEEIDDLEEMSEGADPPLHVEDQIVRLQEVLSDHIMPVEMNRLYQHQLSGFGVLAASLLGIAVLSPWPQLATKSASLIHFTPSLALLLVANCTLCSIIFFSATNYLNDQVVAYAKTFAKATTITLALATLILTAGLAAGGRQGILMAPGLLVYILILMTSLSADNLVFQAEARIKILNSRKQGSP